MSLKIILYRYVLQTTNSHINHITESQKSDNVQITGVKYSALECSSSKM